MFFKRQASGMIFSHLRSQSSCFSSITIIVRAISPHTFYVSGDTTHIISSLKITFQVNVIYVHFTEEEIGAYRA
jgi:hypothetical protein